jgi:hypothetical protein
MPAKAFLLEDAWPPRQVGLVMRSMCVIKGRLAQIEGGRRDSEAARRHFAGDLEAGHSFGIRGLRRAFENSVRFIQSTGPVR